MTELSAPADPVEPMLRMLNGHCPQQALYVAAVLGVADLLFVRPMDADGLATEVKADPDSLRRLLRTLASVGVFEEGPDSRFSVNSLGATLRTDAPNPCETVRSTAALRRCGTCGATSCIALGQIGRAHV